MCAYSLDGDTAAGASRVGADLREARQRLGWQLADVASMLRIRLPYLQAIEDGRVSDLPGPAYAVGFLRTYASALGLDADEMSRRFRAETAVINRRPELKFPAPVPQRGVPAGVVVLLGVVLAVGGYLAWYRLSGDTSPVREQVADLPDRLAPAADRVAPLPTPPTSPVPSPSGPTPMSAPLAAAAAPVAPPIPTPPPPVPVPVPVSVPAPASLPAAPDSKLDTRLVLRVKADSWVNVREKQGAVLLNRVMRMGETWPVPPRAQLLLTTGNAGATELMVDGQLTPPLGAVGAVRRDIPLDPDLVKASRAATPATPSSTTTPPAQ